MTANTNLVLRQVVFRQKTFLSATTTSFCRISRRRPVPILSDVKVCV